MRTEVRKGIGEKDRGPRSVEDEDEEGTDDRGPKGKMQRTKCRGSGVRSPVSKRIEKVEADGRGREGGSINEDGGPMFEYEEKDDRQE